MFNSWIRKVLWSRGWQPSPVFLPEESHRAVWQIPSIGLQIVGHDWSNLAHILASWIVQQFTRPLSLLTQSASSEVPRLSSALWKCHRICKALVVMVHYRERKLIKGRVQGNSKDELPVHPCTLSLLLPTMICANKYGALPTREDHLSLESKAFTDSHKNVLDKLRDALQSPAPPEPTWHSKVQSPTLVTWVA